MANCTEFITKNLKRVLFSLIILIAVGQLLNEAIYIYEYPKWKVEENHEIQKNQNEKRSTVKKLDTPLNSSQYSTRVSTSIPTAPQTSSQRLTTSQLPHREGLISKECQLVLYGTHEDIEDERKKNDSFLDVGDEPLPWKDDMDDAHVLHIAEDCQILRQKYKFIGDKINSTQQELQLPLAYSIVVHEDSHQLSTLLAAIYREQNIHCIHVDKKSSEEFKKAVNAVASCFPNIFLSSKSQDVVYASIERVLADVNCIDDLLKVPHDWKYMINLCGQDFPLLTNHETLTQLEQLKGTSFIHEDLHPQEHILKRTAFKFKVVPSVNGTTRRLQNTNIPHDPPPYNLTITKNLAYNIFARKFLQWAFVDGDIGRTLLDWSSDTYSPDEHFWILLNNHPDAPASSQHYGYDIVRKIRWINFNQTCRGYYRHGICIFGAGDVKGLIEPETTALFANKFYMSRDSVSVQCIRQQLDERSLLPQEQRPRNPDKIPLKIRLYKKIPS